MHNKYPLSYRARPSEAVRSSPVDSITCRCPPSVSGRPAGLPGLRDKPQRRYHTAGLGVNPPRNGVAGQAQIPLGRLPRNFPVRGSFGEVGLMEFGLHWVSWPGTWRAPVGVNREIPPDDELILADAAAA